MEGKKRRRRKERVKVKWERARRLKEGAMTRHPTKWQADTRRMTDGKGRNEIDVNGDMLARKKRSHKGDVEQGRFR